jgi:hypothetical protein
MEAMPGSGQMEGFKMKKFPRYTLYLICLVQAGLAVAFFVQAPFVIKFWPFEGTTQLTFIFISSIYAAAAASTFWTTATGNYGALAGIGLDYLVMLTPVSMLLFQMAADSTDFMLTVYGIAFLFAALFGLGLMLYSMRIPFNKDIKLPAPVRISFIIFIVALLVVSISLILKIPNIIPWAITPQLSVVIGWMFFGAMTYFIYTLMRPSWLNAAGQLAGFLAYDLVLILPFLTRLPTVAPERRMGLIVYTVVLIYSGALAIYYLFIHKSTRV